MHKSDILYVKGMDMSESDGDIQNHDDGNMWDDTQLNSAYDKALKIANAEVAKRIAMSTNSKNAGKDDSLKSKHKSKKPSNKKKWAAGMSCRAVYEGDGLEYEAFVLQIINDRECLVRFLGYDNSEVVALNGVKPSRGKEAQERQIEEATLEKEDDDEETKGDDRNMDVGSNRAISPGSTVVLSERSFHMKDKKKKKKKEANAQRIGNGFQLPGMLPMPDLSKLKNMGSMDIPMPPPPIPFPSLDRSDSEEQAVSSMLLSWYMSGYYTGLYQGMKRSRHTRKHKD